MSEAAPRERAEAEERFGELIRQYGRLIRSAIRKVSGTRLGSRFEDVEQRIHIELWKQISREQTIEFPSSYVYRAAVRETVRALRQEERRSEQGLDEIAPPMAGSGPDVRARSKEAGRAIQEVIDSLTPERARAVRLHLMGFEVKEIMAIHDWPYHKARNLIARGMAGLRERLRKRGFDAQDDRS